MANNDELVALFPMAQAEARSSFGSSELYVEKLIESSRHVEVQVLGDGENVIHLGHRECSIQRRYQKLVEEAPSPSLVGRVSDRITRAAVRLADSINYTGAGTVEFLLDSDGNFYFIETNTRIQVEHPVTEAVTGLDIVKAQIAIAAGEPLTIRQRDVQVQGHAIEFRLLAEDPKRDFRPASGVIEDLRLPGGLGVRVDSHIFAGYSVPPFYDSLLAKIIVYGASRDEALARARRALDETSIDGLTTNVGFHRAIVRDERFIAADYDLDFLATDLLPVAGVVP